MLDAPYFSTLHYNCSTNCRDGRGGLFLCVSARHDSVDRVFCLVITKIHAAMCDRPVPGSVTR